MKIRMLSTRRGADDGITVRTYEAGAEYELPETPRGQDLAEVFLREGWAVDADAAVEPEAAEPELEPEPRPRFGTRKR